MSRTLCVLALAAVACISPEVDDTGEDGADDTGSSATDVSGQFNESQIQLNWSWLDPWEQGTCIIGEVRNLGPATPGWRMLIGLDQPVERVVSYRDGVFDIEGSRMEVSNVWGTDLLSGETTEFEFCVEPRVKLTDILELELIDEAASQVVDPYLYGAMLDPTESLGLKYQQVESSNGGACLDLSIKNVSGHPIVGWSITMTMTDEATLVDSEGLWPYQASPNTVTVYPDEGTAYFPALLESDGKICMVPLVVPLSITAELNTTNYEPDPG